LVRSRNLLAEKAIDGYVVRLRVIVGDILGIEGKAKYAARGNGRQTWIQKIDSTPVSDITPDLVRVWKKAQLDKAGRNASARRHAATTINSTLRQARSLFGERKVLTFLPGIPNPFAGVAFEPRGDTKFYGVGVHAPTLLRRALDGLKHPEELKAFLLTISLGLRHREADLLQWDSFDFEKCTVDSASNRALQLKDYRKFCNVGSRPRNYGYVPCVVRQEAWPIRTRER
jgi:hypothetical protein